MKALPLCTVDRDYVLVLERALQDIGISPTLTPDIDRPTHYIVLVLEEDIDRAASALKERGAFIPKGARI